MKHDYYVEQENILLRPLERADALLLRELRNKMKHCFLTQDEITREQQLAWYEKYLQKENDYMFAVSYGHAADGFIGAVAIYDICSGAAEVGRVIIDKERYPERGLGKKAVLAACRIGFSILGLHTIYANVLPNNIASLTTFRRLGFQESEGTDSCIYFEMNKECFGAVHTN